MKPAPFAYVRPGSLDEALEALAENPDAKVLAGGQSLIPLLSMRLASPALLVDINAVPDLDHVVCDDDGVRVGALARHAAVEADSEARRTQPLLSLALRNVAHPTIRNRGTTVGSLVHADAAAEMPVVLSLLEGWVTVRSVAGERTIPASELYAGPLETTLHHDEIATEAFFPALRAGQGVAFEEIARRHGDYALCGVAGLVSLDAGGTLTQARLGYLSVSDVPTVVEVTSVFADGLTESAVAAAGDLALGSLDPQGDIHGTSDYRAQLVRVLTSRVLRAAYDDARSRGSNPTGPTATKESA